MPITEKQRARRAEHLGASDVPVALGLCPWKPADDLRLEKCGELESEERRPEWLVGDACEPGILNWASETLGPIVRNQYRKAPGLPLGANLDAIVLAAHEPLDAKAYGLIGPLQGNWGAPGTDEVPEHIIVQMHAQMMSMAKGDTWESVRDIPDRAHVAALLGGRGLVLYTISRNDELTAWIAQRVEAIWYECIVPNVPIPDAPPSESVLKRIRREPNKVVKVSPQIAEAYLAAKAEAKRAAELESEARRVLLTAMGNAEAADCGALGTFTYMQAMRRSLDAKALQAEMPDVARKYAKTTTYRTLRYKKGEPDAKTQSNETHQGNN